MENHYKTLALTPFASIADVKQCFRKLAKQLHPDKQIASPAGQPCDTTQFVAISDAYQFLIQNKEIYDVLLNMQVDGFCDLEDKLRSVDSADATVEWVNGTQHVSFECE